MGRTNERMSADKRKTKCIVKKIIFLKGKQYILKEKIGDIMIIPQVQKKKNTRCGYLVN